MKSSIKTPLQEYNKQKKPDIQIKKSISQKPDLNKPQKIIPSEKKILLKKQHQKLKRPLNVLQEKPIHILKQNAKKLEVVQTKHQQLFPCKSCGRNFVKDSLTRHQKICKKIFVNKRKEFNSAKQRIASKQQVTLLKKNKDKVVKKQLIMPKWKQESLAFRVALKKVRNSPQTQEQLKFLEKEKKIVKESMFKCKFCSRTFNDEAGKRHQQFCAKKAKDMTFKKKK